MLSIGKLGAGQHSYYLGKVAEGAEDYYSGEGEAEGYWLGDAAEDLGLQGKVDADQLVAMLTGSNPVHRRAARPEVGTEPRAGPRLRSHLLGAEVGLADLGARRPSGLRPGHARPTPPPSPRRSATWSARPAGPGAARAAHEFVPGNGFLAAAYPHRSSRAGDPQLHTHVLIANATKGPDGRWSRLYHPAIYEHAKTASYIYEAHLRHELTRRLGVEWQPVRKGIADIKGFSAEELRRLLDPPRRDPRGGRRGRLGAGDAGRDPDHAQGQGPRPDRPRACARRGGRRAPRSASTARRSASASATSDPARRC